MKTRVGGAAVITALLAVGLTSCGEDRTATLTVLAASSLTGTFEELATQFQADHEGVEVRLAFDSSATLAQQVTEGAPADVLATADLATMQTVLDSGDVAESVTFATNELVLVVPASNPAGITGVEDLDRGSVSFVACVETAPCGSVAAGLLQGNSITTKPKSLEVDVKAVLAKVVADEADAGLVYATDAIAAGEDVKTFQVPGSSDAPNLYAIGVAGQSEGSDLAHAWVDLVLSAAGRDVLEAAGFGPPLNE